MNKEILERLNEINKELENIKKEEENDMNNKSEIVDRKVDEFLSKVEDCDFKIFDEYKRITNETDARIEDLFSQVTPDGWLMIVKTLIRVYIYKIWKDEELFTTHKEIRNIAYMGMKICDLFPDEVELLSYMQALIQTFEYVKGGER